MLNQDMAGSFLSEQAPTDYFNIVSTGTYEPLNGFLKRVIREVRCLIEPPQRKADQRSTALSPGLRSRVALQALIMLPQQSMDIPLLMSLTVPLHRTHGRALSWILWIRFVLATSLNASS